MRQVQRNPHRFKTRLSSQGECLLIISLSVGPISSVIECLGPILKQVCSYCQRNSFTWLDGTLIQIVSLFPSPRARKQFGGAGKQPGSYPRGRRLPYFVSCYSPTLNRLQQIS